MKLLIFPGGGNPDMPLYRKVYGLIEDRAGAYGYSSVDTKVRWPGHAIPADPAGACLSFDGAVDAAAVPLARCGRAGKPYSILARSFGTYVALKATMEMDLPNLRRVVLWGSTPFRYVWQMFKRDIDASSRVGLEKGLVVDKTFFPGLVPIESLLQQTPRKVVVATGPADVHSTPAFHAYLMHVAGNSHRDLVFRAPVKDAVHEVTAEMPAEVVDDYLNCILG